MARFTFRHLPVGGLPDITGNFEQIEGLIPAGPSVSIAYRAAPRTIPAAAFTSLAPDTILHDPGSHFSTSKGSYVVPQNGYYFISAAAEIAEVSAIGSIVVGVTETLRGSFSPATKCVTAAGIVYAVKGEQITFQIFTSAEKAIGVGSATAQISVVQVDLGIGSASKGDGGGSSAAPGTTITRSLYHATAVLATGTTEAAPALQSGEEDKITFTTPEGGALYLIAASVAAKNGGGGRGGAALYVDGVRLTDTVAEAAPKNNAGTAGAGTYTWMFTRPTRQTATLFGWELSTNETELTTQSAEPFSLFLAAGAHTVELRLFNEDRGAGKVRERRLMVVGP